MPLDTSYDSKTQQSIKYLIKERIHLYIYKKFNSQHSKLMEELLVKHCQLFSEAYTGFMYKGLSYYKNIDVKPTAKIRNLHQSLHPTMDAFLEKTKKHEINRPYIDGYINACLGTCFHFPTYLEVFPSCLHKPVREVELTSYITTELPIQLSPEEIENLNTTHSKGVKAIKRQLVSNLI